MNIGDMLLKKGATMRKLGKWLPLIGLAILIIESIVIAAMGDFSIEYYITGMYGAPIFTVISLASILAGLPLYLAGLHFLGLGQIAKNTDK